MRTTNKKLFAFALAIIMVIGILPLTAYADRAEVLSLEAEHTFSEISYGSTSYPKSASVSKDEVKTGAPAYLAMLSLQKYNGTKWENLYEGAVQEGTYRYRVQVRIDDADGAAHVLSDSTTLKVNDVSWTVDGHCWISVDDNVSYIWFYSQSYTITKPVGSPLSIPVNPVSHSDSFYVNTAIESFSAANYVIGGVDPITYSKKSGPSWINVSADGTISGTPDSTGNNDPLVITVTDSADDPDSKELTINLPNTNTAPGVKTTVTEVEVEHTFSEISYGSTSYPKSASVSKDEVKTGAPAYLSMLSLQKHNGTKWENLYEGAVQEGTYRYRVQVRIDDADGAAHVLSDSTTLKVNDVSWTVDGTCWISVSDNVSYIWFYSQSFTIDKNNTDLNNMETITKGKPNKGIRMDEPYEYAKPLPDSRKSTAPTEEANPNTGVALSFAPMALLSLALIKRK